MNQILKILALVGIMAAGVLCIVFAITTKTPALFGFAVVAFFGGITGFIYGVSGQPTGGIDPPKIGGKFMGLPDWVLIVDGILLAIAFIIAVVLR